jgi:chromosomal replication initiation ATPase DnaA
LRDQAPPESEPADPAEIEMPGELVPELLEAFLARLRDGMVNPTSFHRWFAPIAAMSRGDTVVYLRVPDTSFAGWIAQYYGEIVEETLAEIGLAGYRFEFVIKRE